MEIFNIIGSKNIPIDFENMNKIEQIEIDYQKAAGNIMNWYKKAQEEYFTKDGRKITFQPIPFNENNDKRGWVVHKILAFVDGKEAGYINLSYIPKEKWESIYKNNNIWTFNRLCNGSYLIPKELENYDDSIIQKSLNERFSMPDNVDNLREKLEKDFNLWYLYFVDKPIVDFIRTNQDFQRQRVAFALHQYANQWLRSNFNLNLWLSYCRTDDGKCFYDSKLLKLKKYRYKEKMPGGFKQEREYIAKNVNWYKKAKYGYQYVGNCGNIFDKETGECLIDIFTDVSDFANKDENAIEITISDFDSFIKYDDIPRSVSNEIYPPYGKEHNIKYFFYDGDILVLYDVDDDIHYFWSKS